MDTGTPRAGRRRRQVNVDNVETFTIKTSPDYTVWTQQGQYSVGAANNSLAISYYFDTALYTQVRCLLR